MPVKWDDLSPEAQERILKEHPDVAPSPPPQADPPAPKRTSSKIRYTDAFPFGYVEYLRTNPEYKAYLDSLTQPDFWGRGVPRTYEEYLRRINGQQAPRHYSLMTKVILGIIAAYALAEIFYAVYGG